MTITLPDWLAWPFAIGGYFVIGWYLAMLTAFLLMDFPYEKTRALIILGVFLLWPAAIVGFVLSILFSVFLRPFFS